MKLRYKNINLTQLLFLLIAHLVLVSCGTYQNTSYDDGIYDNDLTDVKNKKVIIVDKNDGYEENYFLTKYNSLNNLSSSDVFTEVENYNTVDTIYVDEEVADNTLNYNQNQPWGQGENNEVVVSVNLMSNPYWNTNFGYGFYDTWGYRNWRNRGFYGWNQNPYWQPFNNYYAWNLGFYNPYYCQSNYYGYANPYRNYNNRYNNRYYRNSVYGRRTTYNNIYNTRSNTANSRNRSITTKRSNIAATRQPATTSRRSSTRSNLEKRSSTRGTSTTTRKNYAPTRKSSTTRRNTTNINSNTNTRNKRQVVVVRRPSTPSKSRTSNTATSKNSNTSSTRSSNSSYTRNNSTSSTRTAPTRTAPTRSSYSRTPSRSTPRRSSSANSSSRSSSSRSSSSRRTR